MEAGTASVAGGATSPPAGWYANPEGLGERYWTVSEWAQMRAEAVLSTNATASVFADQPQVWWVAVIAGVAMILGGFGPWATAFGLVSVNGTHGDGWFVIAAGGVSVFLLRSEARTRRGGSRLVWAALAGAGGAAVAIADFAQLASTQAVEPAWGIYAAMLGGIALAVASILLRRDRRVPNHGH